MPTDTYYHTIKADETPEQTAERMLSSGALFSPEAYREVIRGLLARPKPPEPPHEVPEYLQPKLSLWRRIWNAISDFGRPGPWPHPPAYFRRGMDDEELRSNLKKRYQKYPDGLDHNPIPKDAVRPPPPPAPPRPWDHFRDLP